MSIEKKIKSFLNEVEGFVNHGSFYFVDLATALKFLNLEEVPTDKAALSAYMTQLIKARGDVFAKADQTDDKDLRYKANAAFTAVEDAVQKVGGGHVSALPKTKEELENPRLSKMGKAWKDGLDAQVKNHVDTLAKQAGMKVVDPGSINKPATFAANVDPAQAAKLANTAKINMEHAGQMYHLARTPDDQKKWQKEYYDMKAEMEKYQKIAQGANSNSR